MPNEFKTLTEGLGTMFADLERRAQASTDLTVRVRSALPGAEKDHVISAIQRDNTLIVFADAAVWATHIRYAQQEMLERLRASGETPFTKVQIRVGAPTDKRA